jgi:hypothetical protein
MSHCANAAATQVQCREVRVYVTLMRNVPGKTPVLDNLTPQEFSFHDSMILTRFEILSTKNNSVISVKFQLKLEYIMDIE